MTVVVEVVVWTGAEEVASVMVTSLLVVGAAVVVTAMDAAGAAVGVVGCVAVAVVAPSFFNMAL